MDKPPDGAWLGPAVTGALAITGAAWALLRKLFSTVSREEFEQAMERSRMERMQQFDKLESKIDTLHVQNTSRLDQLLNRRGPRG